MFLRCSVMFFVLIIMVDYFVPVDVVEVADLGEKALLAYLNRYEDVLPLWLYEPANTELSQLFAATQEADKVFTDKNKFDEGMDKITYQKTPCLSDGGFEVASMIGNIAGVSIVQSSYWFYVIGRTSSVERFMQCWKGVYKVILAMRPLPLGEPSSWQPYREAVYWYTMPEVFDMPRYDDAKRVRINKLYAMHFIAIKFPTLRKQTKDAEIALHTEAKGLRLGGIVTEE